MPPCNGPFFYLLSRIHKCRSSCRPADQRKKISLLVVCAQGCLPPCPRYTYVYQSSELCVPVQLGMCTSPGTDEPKKSTLLLGMYCMAILYCRSKSSEGHAVLAESFACGAQLHRGRHTVLCMPHSRNNYGCSIIL